MTVTIEVAAVMLLATFVRSLFGFGEALVAVPLLALAIPVEVAAPIVELASIVVAAIAVVQDWRHVNFRSAGWLIVSSLFGIPLGLLLLRSGHEAAIKAALGVILLGFCVYTTLFRDRVELRDDRLAWIFGFVAGILGGAYGMNGPPLVIFGSMRRWSPQRFRATLQGYFLPSSLLGICGFGLAGFWTPSVNRLFLWSFPSLLVGVLAGRWVSRRMEERRFRRYLILGLAGIGVVLIFQSARKLILDWHPPELPAQIPIFPENDLRIAPGAPQASSLDRATYDGILDRIEAVYAPIVAAHGARLEIDRNWEDSRVNSYARRFWGHWHVEILGGLARHPKITPDALLLVACHELGHHLGSVPRFVLNWASVEGEADYFATLKCMRTVLAKDPPLALSDVPEAVAHPCQESYASEREIVICERSALAGLALGQIFAELNQEPPPSFETPDLSRSWWIVSGHPNAQCRVDTYLAGALCARNPQEPLGGALDDDPTAGACSTQKGDAVGFRPLCWYRPGGWIL